MRLRRVPSRSTASPSCGGREAAISLRILAESLQPFPDVVTPICRGPSECVERSVKEQRLGASATLMGIRSLRHRFDICVAMANQWYHPEHEQCYANLKFVFRRR